MAAKGVAWQKGERDRVGGAQQVGGVGFGEEGLKEGVDGCERIEERAGVWKVAVAWLRARRWCT